MLKTFEASGSTVDAAIDMACALANITPDLAEIEVLELGGKGIFGFGRRDARVRVTIEVPEEKLAPAAEAQPAFAGFGTKKSKRERFEEKAKRQKKEEVAIPQIVTAEPAPTAVDRPRAPRPERSPRPEWEDKTARANKIKKPERPERTEKREERPRRESTAAKISEGEMADALTAEAMLFLLPIFEIMQVEPQMTAHIEEGFLWLNFSGENLGLLIGRRGETLNSLQYLTNLVVNKHRHDHVRLVLNVEGYREGREETLSALARKMAEKAVKSGRRVELEPMNPHERRVVHLALQEDSRVDTTSHGEEPYRRVIITCKAARSRRRPRRRSNAPQGKTETRPNALPTDAPLPEMPAAEAFAAPLNEE